MSPSMTSYCAMTLTLVGWAACLPSGMDAGQNFVQAAGDLPQSIYDECADKASVACVKHRLLAFVDKQLTSRDEITLAEGVSIAPTAGAKQGTPRALQFAAKDVDAAMADRVQRFLEGHSLKVDIKGADVVSAVSRVGKSIGDAVGEFVGDDEDGGSVGESRGKKKKNKKQLMHLFMLLKFKLMALLPFVLGKIALIAGKALLIGKIALVLSLIVVLQKVLSQHKKTVTYEVVPQPHHDVHGGHDSYSSGGGADVASGGYGGASASGGWGRSLDAQQMAYSAQAPQQQ